jgi:hypothetical protein
MLVHDRPGCHQNDGFRGRRAVAQSTVRSLGVVVFPPFFDDDLRLFSWIFVSYEITLNFVFIKTKIFIVVYFIKMVVKRVPVL